MGRYYIYIYFKKISDLNSELEKKKRENVELTESIEKLELEIKNKRKSQNR